MTYVKAIPEELWRALTGGEFTRRCWFGHRVEPEWRACSAGWPRLPSSLKSRIETGSPLPVPGP
ncbi:hypothetical protein [Actinomadura sp. HBU206391]|uniref:hypothetical protein n=1 Tax=Actinomadura sp. HBU206391 TaxID=2731692 RepID=UPI001C9CDD72|nr:hypothetical protein [Actinomadura sp. HBU206391]